MDTKISESHLAQMRQSIVTALLMNKGPETINVKNFDRVYEVLIDSFSGATGGFLATLMLYPFENFRTRL